MAISHKFTPCLLTHKSARLIAIGHKYMYYILYYLHVYVNCGHSALGMVLLSRHQTIGCSIHTLK